MILRLNFSKLSTGQLPCNKSMALDERNQVYNLKNIYFFSSCSVFWNSIYIQYSVYREIYQYKYVHATSVAIRKYTWLYILREHLNVRLRILFNLFNCSQCCKPIYSDQIQTRLVLFYHARSL